MADNSKYTLGTDFYEGNDISSFAEVKKWVGFVYLRASIGILPDKAFVERARLAMNAGLAVGPYHELWPNLDPGKQAEVFINQQKLAQADTTQDFEWSGGLPAAVAFEPQPIQQGLGKVLTWPNPVDLQTMMLDLPKDTIVYTNLAGLNILKLPMANMIPLWKYWLAEYYTNQNIDGEYPVDSVLKAVKQNFGIQPEQVLFVQTASKLSYPPSVSKDLDADYDRAVSFQFSPAPVPVPAPKTITKVTIQYSDGSEEVRP